MKQKLSQVKERTPNWLPLPGGMPDRLRHEAQVDEGDFFAKGEVVSYLPKQAKGVIQSDHGGQLAFDLKTILVLGEARYLEVGSRVGYDVARTSNGNRLTLLKIY